MGEPPPHQWCRGNHSPHPPSSAMFQKSACGEQLCRGRHKGLGRPQLNISMCPGSREGPRVSWIVLSATRLREATLYSVVLRPHLE